MSDRTRKAMRQLKRSGKSAEELWREGRAGIIESGKAGKWRESEVVASLADFYMDMEIVYGKSVMKKADATVKENSK